MTILFEQNKLSRCPTAHEESWKRTNPEIFFLPDSEVLNFKGMNALENKNKLNPWKICFQDFKNFSILLSNREDTFSKESIELIQQESHRLVVVDIKDGQADVYMNDEIKSHIEFMSEPWETVGVSKNSSISFALASRLKSSSPHKISVTVSSRNNEVPLFIVLNHCAPQFSQSYSFFHLTLKKASRSELIYCEGGAPFSLQRHQLDLEEDASLSEFWINQKQNSSKSIYMERIVNLAENAKFHDAQIFCPTGNMKVISRILFNGVKARSESGGVVIAQQGKFDYEPIQEHNAPQTFSNLMLNMILDNKAKSSFQGLIIAAQLAQKCVAKQQNKNILLSKLARVDCEPRLEILPHDITCKHGSATAEIDPKQIYYLESRGFRSEQARDLILKSFALSVFSFQGEESVLNKIIESSLPHAFF